MKFRNCDQRVLRVPMNWFDLHCNVLEVMNVTVLSKVNLSLDRKLDSLHL